MALYSYDVIKSEEGVFDPTTGAVSGWKEIEVYQDTINLDWPDPVETPHFKQGDPNPKLTVRKMQPRSVQFSIMNTEAVEKKNWMGGEVVSVDGVDSWSEPYPPVLSIIKALRFTGAAGDVMTIVRGDAFGKMNFNPSEGNINLIDVKATVTSTGVASVPGFKWDDPPALP